MSTTAEDKSELEKSPDYWWIRLRYALRDGDLLGAAEAQQQLSALGVEVRIRGLQPLCADGGQSM